MKKLFTLVACAVTVAVSAQQVPNADFESWDSQDKPTDWNTVNSALGGAGALLNQTCYRSTDANSGSYAINLVTVDPPSFPPGNPDINGIASTGSVQTSPPYGVTGGITFDDFPDSLVGYYKYFPSGSDIGTIEMVLKSSGEDTIAHARFETPSSTVNQYTRFSVPFDYRNANTPDLAVHLISSSDGFNPVVGSQIWVDDLEVIYNPVVSSVAQKMKESRVEVYFANNQLYIKNPAQKQIGNIEVYDMVGRRLQTLTHQNSTLNSLPRGFYTYVIPSIGISGKVVVE